MAIYSTTHQEGIDINSVFILDSTTPEYPAPPFQPGELAWGNDGTEWVYCTASVSIQAGMAVLISTSVGPQGYNLTQTYGVGTWSVAPIGGSTVAVAPYGQLVGVVGGGTGLVTIPAPTSTQSTFFWVQRAGIVPNLKTDQTSTILGLLHTSATVAGALNTVGGTNATVYSISGLVFINASGSLAGPNTALANYPTAGYGP